MKKLFKTLSIASLIGSAALFASEASNELVGYGQSGEVIPPYTTRHNMYFKAGIGNVPHFEDVTNLPHIAIGYRMRSGDIGYDLSISAQGYNSFTTVLAKLKGHMYGFESPNGVFYAGLGIGVGFVDWHASSKIVDYSNKIASLFTAEASLGYEFRRQGAKYVPFVELCVSQPLISDISKMVEKSQYYQHLPGITLAYGIGF